MSFASPIFTTSETTGSAFERSEPAVEEEVYPVCIAGKRNCPPEDCGGVWGCQEIAGHPGGS
ncbi:hypothetical protein EN809_037045 [Mesorhizobium sp. M2E.F.Ca.ET.166.01.1.1]|nr:hypothetical protein EN862_011140 [Mesorhizobium sp. M2E.F.Ca.ET.219.01.1.1]TGT63012.1 hypothetical protein EN809_037045 [Mesorhizobium sp. M2E.F.Ca.ET.166.01.1.1]TGV96641.1 hypothetical protein EN797_037065 [Mesorhizobium sp. M2E.F.Ca.ET.154.01.1.1]